MRMRVTRVGLAVTLAAVTALVGLTGPHWVVRSVLRDVSRIVTAPAHAAETVGLPGAAGVGNAHDRAAAADAALVPAVLLSFTAAVWVLMVGAPRRGSRAVAAGGSRAPPRTVVVRNPS